ncbi:MAG TPA: cytochrome c1, partial [Burkholderiales bacterium]|nr:cytochrome c1 [Burkholderiales bacterium]
MKKILPALFAAAAALFLTAAAVPAFAEGETLPSVNIDVGDKASLQAGARTFVNYCLSCHAASAVRYNSLRDIGLTDEQIKDNLLFTAGKVGEMMNVGMTRQDGKEFFNAPPPDLSVEARVRGAEWLYAYLRGFYKDPSTPTGWNNTVFPHVAMPNVLWQLQGVRAVKEEKPADAKEGKSEGEGEGRGEHAALKFETVTPGKLTPAQYDETVRDLVTFMVWMGEPHQLERKQIGFWVLVVFAILIGLTFALK